MITDLKELKALLALCRKQGVTEIIIGDCHVKFGDMPEPTTNRPGTKEDAEDTAPSFDDLTPEQQMFYAVEGTQS